MKATRKQVWISIAAIAIALLALLLYSLERTAWLFELFEESGWRAMAAAVVVELSAVALLVGAGVHEKSKLWANGALVAILSTQVLGNLSAGYLKGWSKTLDLFGHEWAGVAVAITLWAVANLTVPALVLCLSKLLEQQIALLSGLPQTVNPEKPHAPIGAARPALAHHKSENTERASVAIADGECKYCHRTGLTATEKMRHGKAYKKNGVCP